MKFSYSVRTLGKGKVLLHTMDAKNLRRERQIKFSCSVRTVGKGKEFLYTIDRKNLREKNDEV